ncbi:LexA repressor [Anaerohalosphaera lusitana]|uniref:LexA repressor n=1 Tax=Anaerohalosphaera lusitana TaxID=1936003 RepID=A0A1U9NJJ7_9BACT|nr:transcriptional repressor LexA [Anaerohalosphaera lusitana]AQT67918.1 LexA repressor [Anaerohalosphaera lusitana]
MPRGKIKKITPPQQEAFDEICRFIDLNGYPPTMQELADKFGITAPSVVDRVNQLIYKGYIERTGRTPRSLRVLKRTENRPGRLKPVPIVGTVAAGMPIFAEENICGEVLVDSRTLGRGEHFACEVSGESMICAGIKDGSLIIVRRQQLAQSGDIVVAFLNGEVTVKRLRINNERIELVPENSKLEPIIISNDDELRILGRVVGCKHKS